MSIDVVLGRDSNICFGKINIWNIGIGEVSAGLTALALSLEFNRDNGFFAVASKTLRCFGLGVSTSWPLGFASELILLMYLPRSNRA